MLRRDDAPAPLLDVIRGFLAGGRSSVSESFEGSKGSVISIFFVRFVLAVGGGSEKFDEPDDLGGGRERPEGFDGAGTGASALAGGAVDSTSFSLSTSLP
jgi:hypothetical protein